MSKGNILKTAMVTVAAASFLLFFGPESTGSKDKSCKNSVKETSKKKDGGGGDKVVWESLPQHFFSSN